MPWKESHQMDERVHFISRILDGEKMTDLCSEFGISRKTGYKFLSRYKTDGIIGLEDVKSGPRFVPHKTSSEVENLILKLRQDRPHWGPKKIQSRLLRLYPEIKLPVSSTIGDILKRNGYVEQRRKRKKQNIYPYQPITKSHNPNDVWCIDFKGHFRLGNGKYCYPLTVTDHYSRFLLGCEAFENTKSDGVFGSFERIFTEYGVPNMILSDNGSPFASPGIARLSRLSAWFITLGIRPQQIEPGHPEQNGRHERMHKTLKQETTRPTGKNMLQQQEKFDNFRDIYNCERPHEALEMNTPSSYYKRAQTYYSGENLELQYPLSENVRKVGPVGTIRLPTNGSPRCFIGRALQGYNVGLTGVETDIWKLQFKDVELGYITKHKNGYCVVKDKPESVT